MDPQEICRAGNFLGADNITEFMSLSRDSPGETAWHEIYVTVSE
jgi:hypothetical protein